MWREALLALAVLRGETVGYRHHPQLLRFHAHPAPRAAINAYLAGVLAEAQARGYAFDARKVGPVRSPVPIGANAGQVAYEWQHLRRKLRLRNPGVFQQWRTLKSPQAHPLFRIVPGPMESWERPLSVARKAGH